LVRFIQFNLLWFLTAFLAKTEYINFLLIFFLALLFWDLRLSNTKQRLMAVFVVVVGLGFDFVCQRLGVIRFIGGEGLFLPRWLIALWILFAWVVPSLIIQFKDRRILLACLSLVFGPLSYYSGVSFDILNVTDVSFYWIYAIFWGIFIYLVHFLTHSKIEVTSGN
tara:strand:- start:7606 stop:8103 length:498 start_codon:yes stop_codon:yes gene_type:complete